MFYFCPLSLNRFRERQVDHHWIHPYRMSWRFRPRFDHPRHSCLSNSTFEQNRQQLESCKSSLEDLNWWRTEPWCEQSFSLRTSSLEGWGCEERERLSLPFSISLPHERACSQASKAHVNILYELVKRFVIEVCWGQKLKLIKRKSPGKVGSRKRPWQSRQRHGKHAKIKSYTLGHNI